MRVLVTGAAGFIGSHLSEELIKRGYSVIGIDCFTDYYSPRIKERNLEGIIDHPYFTLYRERIQDLPLKEVLSGVEIVFHLASQPGVRASWGRNFDLYVENNIRATQLLLEACRQASIKRFVYSSSSSVYGDTPSLPMQEDSLLKPISPYGVTKLAGENLVYLYYKTYGIPGLSLRYFTVFGPRQRPDMAFHRFIRAALLDEEVSLFGTGEQTRDFTYVADVVEVTITASLKGTPGEVYNIGGGNVASINDTIEIIEKILKKRVPVNRVDFARGDMVHTYADTNKAKKKLDFNPRVTLEEGLLAEIEWLKTSIQKGE